MANLIDYLTQPLRKLFSTSDFKSAVRRYTKPVSPVSYPFQWYPEAGLTNEGVKFRYADGTELISYHIKGVYNISNSGNGFEAYLCSVNFPGGSPFLFPGSITGSFLIGTGQDDTTMTPLANGGMVLLNGMPTPVSSLDINLYSYGGNPNSDGSYTFALVMDATVENPDNQNIGGLVSYDFEFLLPSTSAAPTIFQD